MVPFANVSFRVTPVLLAQMDRAAADRAMTRSDWLRLLIIDRLNDEFQRAELKGMEQRLLARMDEMKQAINSHTTREIDTLTNEPV